MHNPVLGLCPTLLLLGTLSASLLGCPAPAAVPLAPATLDQRAKDFAPPLGQALIYVVRQPGTAILGGFVVLPVAIDGTALGAVAPGLHQVTSLTTENQAAQTVRVDAGQVAFVGLVSRIGWLGPQVALRILDEAAGREAVQAAAMGQTSP